MLSTSGSVWKSILKLKPLFHNCAQSQIVSGQHTSFWFDNWAGQPLATENLGSLMRRATSVFEARHCFFQFLPAPLTIQQQDAHDRIRLFTPRRGRNKLHWNISPSGLFTVNSAYALLSQARKMRSSIASLWKAKVTPSIKCFFFLLPNNRILTQDVMQRKKLQYTPGCVMCVQPLLETAMHLFFECTFAAHVWSQLSSQAGYTVLTLKETLTLTYLSSAPTDKENLKSWRTLFMTAKWHIWKERNNRIFRRAYTTNSVLADRINQEAILYIKYC